MESFVKILIGLGLMGLSLIYLYRPSLIVRANEWARVFLFNDANLLHYRRQWGLLAFLAGILFLYSGMLNKVPSTATESDPLKPAYSAFYAGHYNEAIEQAEKIFQDDPNNLHAEFLLRMSRLHKLKTNKLR